RHPRQGARWGQRRLHERTCGDHRAAAAALPALPVLERPGAGDRRGGVARVRPARDLRRPSPAPVGQHRLLPEPHGGAGLRRAARTAPDRPGDVRRRRGRQPHGGDPARPRRLRHRLLLPGRPARDSTDPHADVGRPYPGRPRAGSPGLRGGSGDRAGLSARRWAESALAGTVLARDGACLAGLPWQYFLTSLLPWQRRLGGAAWAVLPGRCCLERGQLASTTIAAPTVTFVASSTMMNPPV